MTAEEFARYVGDSPDVLVRQLRAASVISEELAPMGIVPVVVGGSAVEFYTRGSYTTMDLDLIVDGLQEIDRVLKQLGFARLAGTSHVLQSADVVVDLLPEPLAGDPSRIVEVDVNGRTVRIIGLEDIIADRLRAALHWQDLSSQEWAIQLMAAQWESVDWDYLNSLVMEDSAELAGMLADCRQIAENVVRRTFGDGDP